MSEIKILSHVALTVDLPDIQLTRGQLGTVVELLGSREDAAFLVEFSDEDGHAYKSASLRADQILVLHRQSEAA